VVTDRTFARLLVVDIYRRRLGELTQEEAVADGARSLEQFRKGWEEKNGAWDPSEIVRVIEFRPVKAVAPEGR
jgi:hypothetical protein